MLAERHYCNKVYWEKVRKLVVMSKFAEQLKKKKKYIKASMSDIRRTTFLAFKLIVFVFLLIFTNLDWTSDLTTALIFLWRSMFGLTWFIWWFSLAVFSNFQTLIFIFFTQQCFLRFHFHSLTLKISIQTNQI